MTAANELVINTPRVFLPLLEPAPYKGVHGGRGSGKSHFFAERLVEECLDTHIRFVGLREVQASIKQSVKLLIQDKIAQHGLKSWFHITDDKITGPHESSMIFMGMQDHTADSVKSLEGINRAWFEEAQRASKKSLSLLRPTIRNDGAEFWASWNPDKETDPIDVLLRGKNKIPGSVVVQANYRDNPYFPDRLRSEMEYDRSVSVDDYNNIWLGKYKKISEARVFKRWRIGRPPLIHNKLPYLFGMDFGFARDPSVVVRCHIEGKILYVTAELWKVGVETVDYPDWMDTLDPLNLGMARRYTVTADSARPETISHLKKHGYPKVTKSVKGPKSVEEGVRFLQSYEIVVDPDCEHVIDELSNYEYTTDKLSGQILPVLPDKKNHVIDALRYAVESSRKNKAGML